MFLLINGLKNYYKVIGCLYISLSKSAIYQTLLLRDLRSANKNNHFFYRLNMIIHEIYCVAL